MRIRYALIPVVMAATLAGCATVGSTTTASPSVTASPTPASNGVAALSGDEIVAKAAQTLDAADSYTFKGTVTTDSLGDASLEQLFGTTVDLEFDHTATNNEVILSHNTSKLDIRVIDPVVYIFASDDVLPLLAGSDNAQAAALFSGKWLKAPSNNSELSGLTELGGAFSGVLDDITGVTKGDESVVNGVPVVAVKDSDGDTLYVATTGDPVPVKLEHSSVEFFDFENIGSTPAIQAPPAEQVFDLSPYLS